jgi:hypothetical protein
MPQDVPISQPLQQINLYLGRPARPEEIFGAHYRVWERYHAGYRQFLLAAVWAALLMRRAVIPLNKQKKPLVKWKAFQTDPADIEQVLAWQRQFHPSAWAVVTGRRYGFLVLDLDGARGFETMRKLQIDPHVRTGSGGHHAYVQYPDDLDVRTWNARAAPFLTAILPGTDIKANGGYAVFAGASKKGSYRWLRRMWPDPCTTEIHDLLEQVINASRSSARPAGRTNRHATYSSSGKLFVGPNGVPVSTLLNWAWMRSVSGRNAAGFELACQARDNGYAQDEAEAILAEYGRGVGSYDQHGEYEAYTETEALASVAQAYSRPPRQPWSLPSTSSASATPSSASPPPPPSCGSPPSPPNSAPPAGSSPPPPGGPRLVLPRGPQPRGRQMIVYEPPLTAIVNASLDALDSYYQSDPQLFVRGNQLAEVVRDEQDRYHLRRIDIESLKAHLDRAIEYLRRKKQLFIEIFPPVPVVKQILARSADRLPFPPLIGIVKSPIMRANSTVLERAVPGYDTAARYYCAFDPAVASLGVPPTPSDADLVSAVALLRDLVCDVCFAEPREVYLANYLAILLTPLVRLMIDDNLPLFAIDATKPRSGKGLLAAIVGIVANGYPTPVTTGPEPNESGEWRKKITTFLLAGESIVVIDNIVFNLNSAELCALVTTRNYTDRILGTNTSMTADPLNSMWIFTGNSLQPVGDLVKRCFWVRLDPQRSDPEKRTGFKHEELLCWAAANRAMLLRALLTMVRAWVIAGEPVPQGVAPFGGFDRWIRVVGGIVQFAGFKQFFQDPVQASYSDPDAEQWLPFLRAVEDVTYKGEFTTAELATTAQDVQWIGGHNVPSNNASKLRDHLPDELTKDIDTAKFRATLGYAFRKKRNTYYGPENIHIANTGKQTRDGAVLWQVRQRNQTQASAASQASSTSSSASPSPPTSSASSTSASTASVPPAVGTVRHKGGQVYIFDGTKFVRRP